MSGHPVVAGPIDHTDNTKQEAKSQTSTPFTNKGKKSSGKTTEEYLVRQAMKNVGRLPSKVLRYVELMACNLPDKEKSYYSNVGNKDGPSKEAAVKRISRRIAAM